MLKCEIERNLIKQTVDIYIFNKEQYLKYDGDNTYSMNNYESWTIDGLKPFISLPYDVWDLLENVVNKEPDYDVEGSRAHLKDLRWVLTHFINKDKK